MDPLEPLLPLGMNQLRNFGLWKFSSHISNPCFLTHSNPKGPPTSATWDPVTL